MKFGVSRDIPKFRDLIKNRAVPARKWTTSEELLVESHILRVCDDPKWTQQDAIRCICLARCRTWYSVAAKFREILNRMRRLEEIPNDLFLKKDEKARVFKRAARENMRRSGPPGLGPPA